MNGALFLGWRYLLHHRLKTSILVVAIALMLFLPAGTRILVEDGALALKARAEMTPLVLGARGSELDLVLNTLYFHAESPPTLRYDEFQAARSTQFAKFIPIDARFQTQGSPIVGTSLDYFSYRNLSIASGRQIGLLGECVIGANVAADRNLRAGDFLISSPETVFDIAGIYPLKMSIAGVLAQTGTADDNAVFVDVRTSWIIQGLGHGHADLSRSGAIGAILNRSNDTITANAALTQASEVTRDNVTGFHFHGAAAGYPLTGVIAVPSDPKAAALLRGRYQSDASGVQLIVPEAVLEDLLDTVFTVQNYVVLGLAMLSLATIAVICLVLLLSQQLRANEFRTLSRIGASRSYITLLVASEIGFVFLIGLAIAAFLTAITRNFAMQLMGVFLSL